MLTLQLYVQRPALSEALAVLDGSPGIHHLIQVGGGPQDELTLLTAEVDVEVVDTLLPSLRAQGIPGDDIELVHRESNRPLGVARPGESPAWSGGGLAWTELAMSSRQYTRAAPRYLVVMACAGIIAVFGVLTRNSILVVGAMAMSPDLLPMCAACVGLADRRPRLAFKATAALLLGLAVASLAAFLMAALLRVAGYAEANAHLGDGGLGILPTVNVATVIVAFVAGVAGVLAFETRSSSAVGVAISITTIPAAAYIGASGALHEGSGMGGAAAVLAVNVVMLVLGGTLTMLLQRRRRARLAARDGRRDRRD